MMSEKELPKPGDKIPIEKCDVSKLNMRYGQPFPADEDDEMLIANIAGRVRRDVKERVTELISFRPEGDGYGAYKGGRRLQAVKIAGVKELVVGKDCVVRDVTDQEAADASWTENLPFLRKQVDPITRAEKLRDRLADSGLSLRELAKRDGIAVSTYSEWESLLKLTPKMRDAVREGNILYSDAREVTRLEPGKELQDKLATVAQEQGMEAFKEELAKVPTGKSRRGAPPGIYDFIKVSWDTRYKPDMEDLEKLSKQAKAAEKELPEYAKEVLRERARSAA